MAVLPEEHWYAVYTRPRSEKKLRDALDKAGVECYLPLLRTRKKWSDRYKWVEEPVFPSYLFVRLDLNREALKVLRLPHAVQFVSTGGNPTAMNGHDIELLRIAVDNFAESMTIQDTAGLNTGETIRIQEGPFAGKEAIIERIHGKTIVIVSFPALNKAVLVEVSVNVLARQ